MQLLSRSPRCVPAFTLVELLLCLSIVALAMLMAVPALHRARSDALLDACLANQQLLGVGWASYAADFNAIPANENDGCTYAYKTLVPGTALYGSFAVWLPDRDKPQEASNVVGAGHFFPYVNSKTAFYCPGEPTSSRWQQIYWDGQEWTEAERTTIVVNPDLPGGWGQPAKGVFTTYYYRGQMYRADKMPTSADDRLQVMYTPRRPDSAAVQGKPFLTCHWSTGLFHMPARTNISHGGEKVNLAYPDGSAVSWALPQGVLPLWQWYEQPDPDVFDGTGFDSTKHLKQLPWWWTLADNRAAE